jgi:hypothetical protein
MTEVITVKKERKKQEGHIRHCTGVCWSNLVHVAGHWVTRSADDATT